MNIIYALLSSFSGLPNWTRWVFVGLSLAGVFGLSAFLNTTAAVIVIVGLVAVALLMGLFRMLVVRARQKRAAAFGSELQRQSASTPQALNDPARRARLEELRQSFEKGLSKYHATGKDLYKLPWYTIIGEPGAGKTEAIRHSDVGFPPGMQDEFQGVGGTINMNWWFTNEAVILDTAGRLIFEEVEPGTTSEWQEFLGLLRKHRPNCPVNGLFLVIPAESLIKDGPAEIKRKAGRIAQQLEGIQKVLDIRFPVYVLVTKCDLLNGFREFFDELNDPAAQQQMLGWSNPDPLDAPFRVELVDEHIYTVVQRLRRRRFGLLQDPIARSGERRTDEVDRLYALPHSVHLIAPNLRQYLQTIFVAGEWSARPLFLRGIYFTSSMREGSALDQELANALNLDVDQLPEGRAWETDRSYFLHDLFTEKSFCERGLVTRATNTKRLILQRRLALFGTASAALLALLAFSVLGYRSLQNTLGRQTGYWVRASEGWNAKTWNPIVAADGAGGFRYAGSDAVGSVTQKEARLLFDAASQPLTEFHQRLHEFSATPLQVPWAFRPLSKIGVEINRDRKAAQRIVFEGGVTKPLLDAARQKMAGTGESVKLSEREQQLEGSALLGLIRLEAGLVKRMDRKPWSGPPDVFAPLWTYAPNADPGVAFPRLFPFAAESLGGSPAGWPAPWSSGGFSLAENAAIAAGLNRFIADAQQSLRSHVDGFPVIVELAESVRRFAKAEDDLYVAARTTGPVERTDAEVLAFFSRLESSRQALDLKVAQARDLALFPADAPSLITAYDKLMREGRAKFEIAKAIQAEVNDLLGAAQPQAEVVAQAKKAIADVVGERREYTLFREIREKLRGLVAEMETKFRGSFSESDVADFRQLDELHLKGAGGGASHYLVRWNVYQKSIKAGPERTHAQNFDLIGAQWKPLTDVFARIGGIREEVQGYNGQLREKVLAICNYCFLRAELLHSDEFCKAYLTQLRSKLGGSLRFPLVWPPGGGVDELTPDELGRTATAIGRVRQDLSSRVFDNLKSPNKPALLAVSEKLGSLQTVCDALLTPDKSLRLCRVVLLGRKEQFDLSGQQTAMGVYRAVQVRAGTIAHGSAVKYGTPGRVPTEASAEVELGRFTTYEPFHFHFHTTVEDSRVAVDMPAPAEWTALQLIHERAGLRVGDGTQWQVALTPATGKLIWIELRFDKPLPPLDEWPTKLSTGLANSPSR